MRNINLKSETSGPWFQGIAYEADKPDKMIIGSVQGFAITVLSMSFPVPSS
jgi:hypothetical protein